MAPKRIGAAQFKARCLGLLDEVARTGEPLVVTKRGQPVARVVPVAKGKARSLRGSVKYLGDIVAPLGEKWEADE